MNQHAWDKARGLLLEAMDDPDPGVRGVSIETLALMASDPLVRDRLKRASVEEPAVVPIPGHPELPGRYYHREAALRALGPPNDPQMANVTRNSVTRECRVQAVSEVPVGEVYIGPVRQAPQAMCGHLDTTGKDPSLCWLTVPADACARRAN